MTPPAPRTCAEHAALPPIPTFPRDRPVAFVLRHAERPPLPEGEPGNDLTLTSAGVAASVDLGAMLGCELHTVHTSPVRRCRETAEHIRAGCRQEIAICDDRLLGDPGIFVADPELAWRNWEQFGHEGVIERLVRGPLASGDRVLPGMREPRAAARILLAHVAGALTGAARLHVFVTHDAVLAPFIAHLLDVRDRDSWPRFLEGAAIWRSKRGVHIRYREHEGIAP